MALKLFGVLPAGAPQGGEQVWLAELKTEKVKVEILSYGAIIHRVLAPDRKGRQADVVLGTDSLGGYMDPGAPAGSVIGRVANRIKNHSFSINGKRYALDANENRNTLHSGSGNYAHRNYAVIDATDTSVRLAMRDRGEGGFPGEVTVEVCYTLSGDGTLLLEYSAVPTMDTPFNPTNHVYFNLAGHGSGKLNSQSLSIDAALYTPTDSLNIPTGEVRKVKKTPLDFTKPRNLSEAIYELEMFDDRWDGFDYNFVIDSDGWRKVAEASDTVSGRALEVFTDLPGIQLYTANHVAKGFAGKDGALYQPNAAFCLETQFFPDSIHKPHFPGGIAFANELFTTATAYRFSVGR